MSYVWFLVIILNEGSVHAFPSDSEAECIQASKIFHDADTNANLTKSVSCIPSSQYLITAENKDKTVKQEFFY